MNYISEIKKEHVEIRAILEIILLSLDESPLDFDKIKINFYLLRKIWNQHERKEDKLFNHMKVENKFPVSKSILEQHRQLKGHWKVLNDALITEDEDKIKVAIDTDGRMLVNKFLGHMSLEENYLDKIEQRTDLKIPQTL